MTAGEGDEGDPMLQRLRAPAEATSRRSRPRRSSPTGSAGAGPPVAATTTEDGGEAQEEDGIVGDAVVAPGSVQWAETM